MKSHRGISLSQIREATERLEGVVIKTPIVKSRFVPNLFFKCENLQYGGSFKIRGAYNKISSIRKNSNGVITYSAGNHGQGVALASKWLGIKSTVVMPKGAVQSKVTATKRFGAKVIQKGNSSEELRLLAELLANRDGLELVQPFDDPAIIAGQGTISVEIIDQLNDVDNVIVQIGGGGLAAGIIAGLANKKVKVFGVEPKGVDKVRRSIQNGKPVIVHNINTVADGLRVMRLGELNFQIINKLIHDIVAVTEEEIVEALRHIMLKENLIVEPSGAVSVAAVISGRLRLKGKTVAILSGGNVDLKSISFGWGMQ